jgi:hypothetical protein
MRGRTGTGRNGEQILTGQSAVGGKDNDQEGRGPGPRAAAKKSHPT